MAVGSRFTQAIRESVRRAKEKEAMTAAERAAAAGDTVAAAHHEGRARAFQDFWSNPDAQREVDDEATAQLRDALGHPDADVRESARRGLEDFGVHVR